MIRKRKRVTLPPVLFTNRRRMDSVPKVELFAGSEVKSRTRFGGLEPATVASRKLTAKRPLRLIGPERFSGPGEPSRCPAPADVPLVSTKMKLVALVSVSSGKPPDGQAPRVVMLPCLPQLSR